MGDWEYGKVAFQRLDRDWEDWKKFECGEQKRAEEGEQRL